GDGQRPTEASCHGTSSLVEGHAIATVTNVSQYVYTRAASRVNIHSGGWKALSRTYPAIVCSDAPAGVSARRAVSSRRRPAPARAPPRSRHGRAAARRPPVRRAAGRTGPTRAAPG